MTCVMRQCLVYVRMLPLIHLILNPQQELVFPSAAVRGILALPGGGPFIQTRRTRAMGSVDVKGTVLIVLLESQHPAL